ADTFGYSMPPPGLLRLGGALERAGHAATLVDLPLEVSRGALSLDDAFAAQAAELLAARGPQRVYGISTMGATLPSAVLIADALRARDASARIALGGPGCGSIDAEVLRRFHSVDAIVRGEGEATLVDWLARIEDGRAWDGCAGLTWRRADGAIAREPERAQLPPRDWPPHAWHLVPPIDAYKRAIGAADGLVALDSGRGCAYDCSFCSIGRYWGRRTRPLDAARLADEIDELLALPGARAAYLAHDLFGTDREHALALCAELERRGGRPFEIRARADALDEELVAALGRAGCYRVLVGVESGDPALRNAHGKHLDPACDVLALVARLDRAGITPILSLLLGLPGEDEAALERTLALALDASLLAGVNLSLHLPNPQQGCRLGDDARERARLVDGIAPDMALGAGTTAPERALVDAHPDLFGTFRLLARDEHEERALRRLARMRDELGPLVQRLPRTFALVARRLRLGVGALFDRWQASGRSFEALARGLLDPLVDDVLAWETALLRAGATPQLLELGCDLVALRRALADPRADPFAARTSPARTYAVARGRRGPRTLRLSDDLARALRARSPLPHGARVALERAGLLSPTPATNP
ncbi:MAG: B12-binding domain-containing radical SAM protein, partial [Planctomycetota bacterium]